MTSAVFMPTGALANHVAVRELAGRRRKVIVPAESHLYNDSGDCVQTLSGLNLIPLAPGRATFTRKEVEEVLARTRAGRVTTRVGVIVIESPVRRLANAMFDLVSMREIADLARTEGIKLHLDGARLPVAAVHTGVAPAEFAALFDTVYVSLYKCFNAASGAILAGPRTFTENLFHARRMFGGGMPLVWPFAAVALQYLDGYLTEYGRALELAEEFFTRLSRNDSFTLERVPHGTNICHLRVNSSEPEQFRQRLAKRNIHLRPPANGGELFTLKINPSLNRTTAADLADAFVDAL